MGGQAQEMFGALAGLEAGRGGGNFSGGTKDDFANSMRQENSPFSKGFLSMYDSAASNGKVAKTSAPLDKAKDQAKSTPYKPKQRSTILTGAPARQGDLRQPDTNAKAQLGN